jgi:hypothetical protein
MLGLNRQIYFGHDDVFHSQERFWGRSDRVLLRERLGGRGIDRLGGRLNRRNWRYRSGWRGGRGWGSGRLRELNNGRRGDVGQARRNELPGWARREQSLVEWGRAGIYRDDGRLLSIQCGFQGG